MTLVDASNVVSSTEQHVTKIEYIYNAYILV